MNNADYGLTLQKMICDKYGLDINDQAQSQFDSSYNANYEEELKPVIDIIFGRVGSNPRVLLTYSKEMTEEKENTSPHNFLLENNKTLSIRTTKTSSKIAPRTVGQAGLPVLNSFFKDIYGKEIKNQKDIKTLFFNQIHEILPVFIDYLFQSDFTVFLSKKDLSKINIIRSDEVSQFSFVRNDFSFTRDINEWKESTTLKYHGTSIAEIQVHKRRNFKFRFIEKNISLWLKQVKLNNETLGISAEGAVCRFFDIEEPESFKQRVYEPYVKQLMPAIKEAFEVIPKAIEHSGSKKGERGEQSKCSYDFVLKNGLTLSLKTNKGTMVCPPEVGQPGAKTCLLYFEKYFDEDVEEVTSDIFKEMVYNHIDEIIPIYINHLFDSDWLLWIYLIKDEFHHIEIEKDSIKNLIWEKSQFTFTKPNKVEWNESNTVKYNGITIGEFQVHKNRSCYKFRFNMKNLLDLIIKD